MSNAPAYTADDRSLLLPLYKRLLIAPALPYLPARLNPNTITHAGHVANLAAVALLVMLRPTSGWPFVAAIVLSQVYLWCDNADGGHARNTGQTSTYGEFLDHGLDIFNTAYIGVVSAFALGTASTATVTMVLLVPGAAAVTCWEQAETGVFRLGLLNQIESLVVLAVVMGVSAALGNRFWPHTMVGPLSLQAAMLLWTFSTIAFGKVRSLARVRAAGRPLAPALAFIALILAVIAARATGVVSTSAATVLSFALNAYFGFRMLASRLLGTRPALSTTMLAGAVTIGAVAASKAAGHPLDARMGPGLAALWGAVYTGQSLMAARDLHAALRDLEQGTTRDGAKA